VLVAFFLPFRWLAFLGFLLAGGQIVHAQTLLPKNSQGGGWRVEDRLEFPKFDVSLPARLTQPTELYRAE
jgi:hypothetical protein